MSCGVGHRHGSDLVLLWLWHRLAAVALIRPLAWELPCAVGTALKRCIHTKYREPNFMLVITVVKLSSVSQD